MIMKGNWASHIPLNALSTTSLLAVASSSKDDSYQNVTILDGGSLKLVSPKLNKKDEILMTSQDWLHAHLRFVSCIRQFLPGPANDVADMWACHFNLIYNRVDFFLKFHLYLAYDIRLCRHYVYDTSFNPASWQSVVWDQIVEDARTKHLSPLPSSAPAASGSSAFSSFRSSTKGTGNLSFRSSLSTRPSLTHLLHVPVFAASSVESPLASTMPVAPPPQVSCPSQMAPGRLLKMSRFASASTDRAALSPPAPICKHLCSHCGSAHLAQECNL